MFRTIVVVVVIFAIIVALRSSGRCRGMDVDRSRVRGLRPSARGEAQAELMLCTKRALYRVDWAYIREIGDDITKQRPTSQANKRDQAKTEKSGRDETLTDSAIAGAAAFWPIELSSAQ